MKFLYEKIKTHSFCLKKFCGMLEIMEKQFQINEVRRLGMRKS